ncbi:exostosin family protein [Candidatus Nomurabacteria bacterium]|nr:exostosin family protein [Candidatus Nomurabacteria bacterium]
MLKIYLYKREEGTPDSYLLNLFTSVEEEAGLLFQKVPTAPFKRMVQFVTTQQGADYMMIPHSYFSIKDPSGTYLKEAGLFAQQHRLKTIIFAYGDTHDDILFDNATILRTAKYRSRLVKDEFIIAPFVEDLGERYGVEPISKAALPTVGFAGMTHLPTTTAEMKYRLRLLRSFLNELFGKREQYERQGLYFRRKILSVLSKTNAINLRVQKRKSYSASKSTIQGDPKVLRQQFIDSIKNSHLPLVVRGDGNFSLRFFEVLSLGRVPLFVDTDTPLPFEDEINYDAFILRVDYNDIEKIPEIVNDFWERTSEEKFVEMQQKARQAFEHYLRADAFYKTLFSHLASGKKN